MTSRSLLKLAAYAGCVSSAIILFVAGGGTPLQSAVRWASDTVQVASVFFTPSITTKQIQGDYGGVQATKDPVTGVEAQPMPTKKVRILIVPGHQPYVGGAEFGAVKERDIVVDIADSLAALLSRNARYSVMVARTKTAWNPILQSYFDTHAADITAFQQSQARLMKNHLAEGNLLPQPDQVYHNSVSSEAAIELYGINRWANENGYDITLHLHINDDAERRVPYAGTYDGFAIYVPNHQYSNAEASKAVAEAIAARLNAYHATSTLPREDAGIVEDQKLIAVGSNNSADDAALLIEYGYIYEPQFQNSSVLPVAVADYAYQTYLGLQDFFKDPVSSTYGSVSFPYDWTGVTAKKSERGAGVYALQAALRYLGYYPPADSSFSDCPISGKAGSCTAAAIKGYQNANGLSTTGVLGVQTRALLQADLATP